MMERLETPRGIQCSAQKAANPSESSESLQVAFVHAVQFAQRGGMLCRDPRAGDLQLLRAGHLDKRHGKCRSRVNPTHPTHWPPTTLLTTLTLAQGSAPTWPKQS